MIYGFCSKYKFKDALDWLNRMGAKEYEDYYPIILGWLREATNTIQLMVSRNDFLPDLWTHNMLISGFCKEGNMDEAFRLRDDMITNMKLLPDAITYNTLINGCFEWRSSSEAFKLFEEMGDKGVKPSGITYNIMVKALCKEGKMEEASAIIVKMEENGYCFTVPS
ncbi:hypothetical protein GIB67_006949 [Kingdonia uniflora]|uniref:Pentatricopeptide repeat-containing protein n=1 Tax=Kingdonia uniflora TaxID=39325 RepID=A0A7J7NZ21_9MAGN|nr:hypothetical protein GIB67_006949 [Kingdonia uniflora]